MKFKKSRSKSSFVEIASNTIENHCHLISYIIKTTAVKGKWCLASWSYWRGSQHIWLIIKPRLPNTPRGRPPLSRCLRSVDPKQLDISWLEHVRRPPPTDSQSQVHSGPGINLDSNPGYAPPHQPSFNCTTQDPSLLLWNNTAISICTFGRWAMGTFWRLWLFRTGPVSRIGFNPTRALLANVFTSLWDILRRSSLS